MCVVICAVFIGLTISAQAQTKSQLKVEIPFNFMAKGRELPAGKYRVVRLIATNPDILILKSADGTAQIILMTQRVFGNSPNESSLVFKRYGDTRFLSEVRLNGEKTGNQLLADRAERKLRRQKIEPELVRVFQ